MERVRGSWRTIDVASADLVAGRLAGVQDSVYEAASDLVQVLVHPRAVQDLQRLDARSHGQWVTRKGFLPGRSLYGQKLDSGNLR